MEQLGRRIKKNRTLLFMLIPATVYAIVFCYIPMGGVVVAFKNYNYSGGILEGPWVGLENFKYLFVSGKIWELTRNTLLYNIAFIFLGIIFEVGFAIVLARLREKCLRRYLRDLSSFRILYHGLLCLPLC